MDKIEIIKPGSIVKIGIGDAYYKELQDLAVYFSRMVSAGELATQVENIKENKELSPWGGHFRTLLTLVNEIEIQAREQALTEWVNLPGSL